LQIELAQLQYLLPRLTGMWEHLSRQPAASACAVPVKRILEVDRRRVQERIARLERELEAVRKTRAVQRQGRKRHQLAGRRRSWLHQRRQIDVVEYAYRRGSRGRKQTFRHARSNNAQFRFA